MSAPRKKKVEWWRWFIPIIGGFFFIHDLWQWIFGDEE